ncbi:hypothetical protein V8E54_003258 [Elaphomyces granulatus]|jgi:hypothetical protein
MPLKKAQIPDSPGIKPILHPRTEPYLAGKIYALVVCGAKNPRRKADAAMFGDFMGTAMTMRLFHEECFGTYLSCFDLDGYFAQGRTDIKFGQFGPDKRPLFVYEARKHSTRQDNFFEQVDPADLRNRVVNAIIQLSHIVEEGDVVDIFFQCHGSRDGQLQLGDNLLPSETIANLLTIFSEKVQVNCVGSHCYSGILVNAIMATGTFHRYAISACSSEEMSWTASRSVSNRCRNFRFAQPFVQSLARCKLPLADQTEGGPLTLENHEDFLRQALRDSIPPQTIQTFLTNEKEASLIFLEELILRDQADVLHDPSSTHRRRRVEWPTLDLPTLRRVQTSHNYNLASLAKREVDEAFSAAIPQDDVDFCDQDDWGISDRMQDTNPDCGMLLTNLYWRGRQQSAIWDLYVVLVERGFLKIESLAYPVDYATNPIATIKIQMYLNCFPFVKEAYDHSNLPFPECQPSQCPTFWLAVMIGRGCAHEPGKMFEIINFTGFLGKAELGDLEKVSQRTYLGGTMAWHCDPKLAAGETFEFFGSWLPHGLGHDVRTYPEKIISCLNRFERVEKAYKQYYDLPDSVLVEESRQAEYLLQKQSECYN